MVFENAVSHLHQYFDFKVHSFNKVLPRAVCMFLEQFNDSGGSFILPVYYEIDRTHKENIDLTMQY